MNNIYFTLSFLIVTLLTFGQSTEVGVTEGQLSVSLSGGANYSIPIALPPGINGVIPQISLTYNSQGGNGIAGYGWNISGVSTISRIPSTKFHDGIIDPVDFNVLDRFAFDGQRLMVKNGTSGIYGADSTQYETESFSNVKITSYGVHPSGANYGPAYFLVEYPDGSNAFYGNSSDSRSVTDWAITYWENSQGIRISYNYTMSNNVLDVASIKYGSVKTTLPINEIKFIYSSRKRAEQAYIGGLSIIRNTILKQINVVGNGVGFRNYVLEPEETSLGYQRLKSITEKSGDNTKSYNPTIFSYDNTVSNTPLKASNAATLGLSGLSNLNSDYISGDFDEDGKNDFILFSKIEGLKNKYILFSNIVSGGLNPGKEDNVGNFENIFPASFLSSDNKMLPQGWVIVKKTDTNCSFSLYGIGSTSSTFKHYEKQFDFAKTVTKASNWSYCDPKDYNGIVVENIPIDYYSGDFNGDGLTDVIAVEKSFYYDMRVCNFGNNTTEYQRRLYSGGTVNLFNLDRRITSNKSDNIGSVSMSVGVSTKIFIADFNGDGKSDIYVLDTNFIKVYSLNKDNKLVLLYENTVADPGIIVLERPILLGDYNGDGKIDFVIPNEKDKDSWNFYLATGTKFNKINAAIGISYNIGNVDYYQVVGEDGVTRYPNCLLESTYIANDYNGDGKTDILCQQNLTAASNGFYGDVGSPVITRLALFENQSVTNTEIKFSSIIAPAEVTGIGRNPIPIFTNHNQINQNLEYSIIFDNMLKSFKSPKDNREDVLLKRITNGNGVKETITYKPLQQDPYEPIYTPTTLIETFPNVDIVIAPSFKIVSMLEKQSKDVYKKQLYFYSGAVSNTEGIGFLGFRSTSKTNWHEDNNLGIISSLSKSDINLRGANVENYTVLGLHTPLTINPNVTITPNTIVKDDYTISGAENLLATQSIILKPDTWIKSGSTFTAKISEDANTGTSPNTPTDYITKSILNYESKLLSNKVFKLKNTSTKQFNGLENTSSETYVIYDENNNPLKSTTALKEAGSTVQTTTSEVGYNPATVSPLVIGRPASKKESVTVSGDVMTSEELYFYENNLLSQIRKKGTNTDYITEDNVYDGFGNIIAKTITAGALTPRTTTYQYDPSGRFLVKITDIDKLSTVFEYNLSNGLLVSETNPYGLKTSYLYDAWFKKTTTTDYLGKKNSYVYTRSGLKTVVTSTADDGSISEETFDDLGRKIKVGAKNIIGTFSYVDYLYDIQDRNYKVSESYFGSTGTQWSETKYDDYGRTKQNIYLTGKTTDITYSGLSTAVSDGTKSKTLVKNAMGNVVSMTNTPGGTIKYTYFANGNLKESDFAGVKTVISQDGWGRKTKLVDSSAGTYTYDYNAFGETISETTPNGITIYMLDPAVGKVMQKTVKGTNTDSKTTYIYDASSKLLLENKFEDANNGIITDLFTYDASKRVIKKVETTPYAEFKKEITYDTFGRVNTETSTATAGGKSSSKTIKNTYKNGSHWQLLDNETSAVLWQTNTVNERGQLKNAQNGPTTVTNEYDSYGLASQYKYDKTANATNILTLNTVFDAKLGNLTSRKNSLFNKNESFKYDAQDRLTEFTNAQGAQEKQLYDDQGRITQNNLGTYGYTIRDKPYQNNAITVTPEALSYYTAKPTQIISYNTFKSPVQIEETGIDKMSFAYNDGNSRTAMFYGGLATEKLERPLRKYYSADGTMEIKQNMKTGVLEFITYIGGDGYSAPIAIKSNGTIQDYLYLQRDYQGSILAITNQAGNVIEKRLFDAWGAIVSVQDGAGNILTSLTILDRGYTGHEHLQCVGLINMNGRIYDPKLHRFLQPDNFVQDPFSTQSFNRYGYCWNNPLLYTDPSGEIIPVVIAAIIVVSAAINVYQNWDKITGGTGKFSDIKWGKLTGYTISGAASGALTVYGGPYGVVIGAGVQSVLNSSINGDDMQQTVINTGAAVAGGFVTRGVALKFDGNFTNGLIGGNNAFNSIMTGATKEVVSSFAGNVTTDLVRTGARNPFQSFKGALDPINLGFSALGGGLTGLNGFVSQPSYIPQSASPLMNSLELKPLVPFHINPNLVIPNYIIPTRNVAPPSFYVPKFKPQFKG